MRLEESAFRFKRTTNEDEGKSVVIIVFLSARSPCFQLSAALFQRGRERRSRDAELPPLPGRERQYAALNFVKLSRAQRGTLFLRFLGTFPPGRLTLGSSSNFSSFFLPSGAAVPAV